MDQSFLLEKINALALFIYKHCLHLRHEGASIRSQREEGHDDFLFDLRPVFLDPECLDNLADIFLDRFPDSLLQIAGLKSAAVPFLEQFSSKRASVAVMSMRLSSVSSQKNMGFKTRSKDYHERSRRSSSMISFIAVGHSFALLKFYMQSQFIQSLLLYSWTLSVKVVRIALQRPASNSRAFSINPTFSNSGMKSNAISVQ